MDIVTLGAALNGSAEYVNSHFKGGSNIEIVDNPDGTQTINASGEVSSEDTVARAEIAAIKDGETLDSFGDVETALDDKANTATTYTKTEVDTALSAKANSVDVYSKTAVDTALGNKADKSTTYTKTEVDTAMSAKADKSTTYTKTEVDTALDDKVDKETGKGLSTNDYTTTEKTKLAGIAEGAEVNEIDGIKVNNTTINPDTNKVVNITVPTTAADVSALPNTIKYAAALSLTINNSTYVMTGQLKDQNGDNLGTAQTIDLPLESVVVGGSYNSQTKKVVLTLQNGNTVEFSVADLVSGLQTELSASNKLNPAFIEYDSTHRAVSDTEKSEWNGKQSALTTEQLAAVNSGITEDNVEQIETNKNNISYLENTGKKNWLKPVPISGVPTGITVQYESDDSITINGTYSGSKYAYVYLYSFAHEAMQYTFSFNVTTSSSTFYFYTNDNKMSTNLTPTYTYTEIDTTRVVMRIAPNTSFDNVNVKLMIRPSIITDTTYQPYAMSNAELTAKEQTNENNISSIWNGNGSIQPYTDIGRLGYTIEVVTLSNVTISKTSTGIFYTSAIDVSDKFDLLLGATLNNFGNLQSNIAIMPAVKPTNKTYSLWICDSTNPATLPMVANTQIQVVLYGITK